MLTAVGDGETFTCEPPRCENVVVNKCVCVCVGLFERQRSHVCVCVCVCVCVLALCVTGHLCEYQ